MFNINWFGCEGCVQGADPSVFFKIKIHSPQYKMKKKILFEWWIFILLQGFNTCTTAQTIVQAHVLCQLPPQLGESSGLYAPTPNTLWSHGDSGNPNELYMIDSTGILKRTVVIRNAPNIDWEELAADTQGNLYIGDFGNNNNARPDLSIYKINNFSTLQKDTVYDAGRIQFSFPDQTAFPPSLSDYLFDCEAMLVFDDSIFLATKDYHAKPYPGLTRIYRIPNVVGTHVATFVAQVSTDNTDKQLGAITGMALSPDKKTVVLIAHQRIYLAENFQGRAFWSVKWRSANINSYGNKEAVAFRDSCTLYLTDDNGGTPSGFLYTINLCQLRTILKTSNIELNNPIQPPLSIKCFPNPSGDDETVQLTLSKTLSSVVLTIFDSAGRFIFSIKKSNTASVDLPPAVFKRQKGLFFVRILNLTTGEMIYQKIIKQ